MLLQLAGAWEQVANKPCAHQDPGTPQRQRGLRLGVSCGGMGQQWSAAGTGALGVGMAHVLLEEVTINPAIELPELTWDWEVDFWRAQIMASSPITSW